tara:strand:- start:514 stop:873 length:360 start_codon:yes stop_codon:yes gene_type:complete
MAFLLKKQYKLPYDICDKINKICMFQKQIEINRKILHMELISYFQTEILYSMHEFYFVNLLSNLHKLRPLIPKYDIEYDVYHISLIEQKITFSHYLLYRDHVNIFLYQDKEYNIYYSLP